MSVIGILVGDDGAITMQQQSIAFGWKLGAIDILQNTGG